MKRLDEGEIIKLSDGREYICALARDFDGKHYLYLASQDRVCFVEQDDDGMRIINNIEEKKMLREKFGREVAEMIPIEKMGGEE